MAVLVLPGSGDTESAGPGSGDRELSWARYRDRGIIRPADAVGTRLGSPRDCVE